MIQHQLISLLFQRAIDWPSHTTYDLNFVSIVSACSDSTFRSCFGFVVLRNRTRTDMTISAASMSVVWL